MFSLRYELTLKKQLSIEYRVLSIVEGACVLFEVGGEAEETVEHRISSMIVYRGSLCTR